MRIQIISAAALRTVLEKTAVYRLLMKTEEGTWLVRRLRHANAEVLESWTTLNCGSLFANSLDREKNGSGCIQVWCLPIGTKRCHCFPVDALHSIRKTWPVERVNEEKKRIERVSWNAAPVLRVLLRIVSRVLPCVCVRRNGKPNVNPREKKKKDIKEDFAY